jgi:tetratricopeptide (TPR) repeat protein
LQSKTSFCLLGASPQGAEHFVVIRDLHKSVAVGHAYLIQSLVSCWGETMSAKISAIAGAIVFAATAGLPGAAPAQQSQAWNWCNASVTDGVSLDQQISGCTTVIQSGKETKESLATAFNYRGFTYHGKGQYDRAIQDYDQAIKLVPDYADAYSNRGADFNNIGQYDRAVRDLNQAIKLNPNDAINFKNRSYSNAKKGQYERAFQDLDQAIKLDPNDAEALFYRSLARGRKGDEVGAKADMTAAKRINPNIGRLGLTSAAQFQ